MTTPVLYDAVTLRHFAAISRLDLLPTCHRTREEPRWTASVKDEIERAANSGFGECRSILELAWLGEAIESSDYDQIAIARLRVQLGNAGLEEDEDGPKHIGEAESIQLAHRLGYCFITDDNDAYRVATWRLGPGRVFDTVALLRLLVATDDMTAQDAVEVTNRIRGADRFLRREYERLLTSHDFL